MGLKALFFGRGNSAATPVTPGDPIFDKIERGEGARLSTRELARHWAVRAVVSQIARGLAGVDVADAMRDPDGDQPTRDQRVAALLRPHLRRIAQDVCRFGEAILVHAPDSDGRVRALVPLPPDEVTRDEDGKYEIGDDSYEPADVLHVAEETPAESPLESLRELLEEDKASSDWRRKAWQTSPRGFVKRPIEAPEWSEEARNRFGASFIAKMKAATVGKTAGDVPVLEEGMEFEGIDLPDAQAAQFVESRQATAEAVASVYGVQGVLLASGENRQLGPARKQLLTGPVADMARLVTECSAELSVRLYGTNALGGRIRPVFDIAGAVRAEDEDSGLTKVATGAPWRTRNEQRAREGLPPVAGGDEFSQSDRATA